MKDYLLEALMQIGDEQAPTTGKDEVTERLTYTVPEAARMLGISRGQAYELARRGELPGVIKLGWHYVVSRSALERILDGQPATPLTHRQ